LNSRTKGKVGEREAAKLLSELFSLDVRRAQQYCGVAGHADLTGFPGVHLEIKRREKGNVHRWMAQARSDCRSADVPLLVHRASQEQWLATCDLASLPRLAKVLMEILK